MRDPAVLPPPEAPPPFDADLLMRILPEAIYASDLTGKLVYASEAAYRKFGYTREEFDRGLTTFGMVIPEERDRAGAVIRRVLAGETTPGYEYTALTRDGRTFPVLIYSSAIRHEGRPIGFCGIIVDITERKIVEARGAEIQAELSQRVAEQTAELSATVERLTREIAARQEVVAALAEGEMKYRALVEGTNDVILRVDAENRIVYVSPQVERYGIPAGSMIGRTGVDLVAPEDRERLIEEFRRTMETGAEFPSRFRMITPALGERWFEDHSRVLRDETGAVIGMTGVLRDITDRLAEEAERRRFAERALEAQKLEGLGVLAGGVAHDFNNMLTAILGHASLARAHGRHCEATARHLDEIVAAAERSAELVRQILSYAGKGAQERRPVDLPAAVREMVSILDSSISKKISVALEFAPDLPPVLADPSQIRQVIMNLAINAAEAVGDRCGTIRLGVRRADGADARRDRGFGSGDPADGPCLLLTVGDDGEGMSDEVRARIFEPFFSTKFIGRGIGMPAVHGIVRGLSGAIRIDSVPGEGTAVRVYIPCGPTQSGVAVPEPSPTPAVPANIPAAIAAVPPAPSRGTLLVVDDEEPVREFVAEALEALGYAVEIAVDGVEAVERVAAAPGRFAAVLLDLSMPRMDGAEAFPRIRALAPDLPVALMSGYGARTLADALAGASRTVILEKPFTLELLEEEIARLTG